MEECIYMTPESTIKELKFALESGLSYMKHNVAELLNRDEVQEICNELGLKARSNANFAVHPDGSQGAYYTLSFRKGDKEIDFAEYFGIEIVSSNFGFDLEPEAPKAPEAPAETPEAPEATGVPETQEAPEVTETPGTPEVTEEEDND